MANPLETIMRVLNTVDANHLTLTAGDLERIKDLRDMLIMQARMYQTAPKHIYLNASNREDDFGAHFKQFASHGWSDPRAVRAAGRRRPYTRLAVGACGNVRLRRIPSV